ncbi:outer membrane protein [Neotamlana laminarinivorans]|uniref:Outer membrane protein beta-barrel domain-containing protein n=1 Tax=Neotamlana laminarinivorans TaxID=2883124 RepID=A0A9X1L3S0_9FLAO|nr:hypothetical protein [Tamlana laminarinivorans]MCB4797546.1 hypothetical protein [Tamlana laminarinivorans]
MKKLFLLSLTILGFTTTINAQNIAENAIGLRLGGSDGLGPEVSYQRALSDNNRLELDLGWRSARDYDGFKLTGLYQWVWPIEGDFNWYAGVGGGLAAYDYDARYFNDLDEDDGETFIFAAGNIGIEYAFDFPLLLSLDFRPEIGFGDDFYDNNDLDFDIALGVRYQF